MTAPQNARETEVIATAFAAAVRGLGALVVQQTIESQDANAKAGVAKLKSTDDSVFANSLRKTQEKDPTHDSA